MLIENQEKKKISLPNSIYAYFFPAGIVLVTASGMLFALIFFPIAKEEIKYAFSLRSDSALVASEKNFSKNNQGARGKQDVVPLDEEFGIVIPKISANAKVVAEVDPQNSQIYQKALTEGVAHAKGTAYPNEEGNVFIFAHSSADFFEASKYNAVFYLLYKLEEGDNIYLFYKGKKYGYTVREKKKVNADEISYLEGDAEKKQLTLMTCWPPGTTLKRLLIIAEQEYSDI